MQLGLPMHVLTVFGRLPSLVRQSETVYQLTSPGLTAYTGLQASSKKTIYFLYRILA